MCSLPKSAPNHMLTQLASKKLVLSDLDIRAQDLPPICRFLNSKQVIFYVDSATTH
jgi:DNA-directed RNA polymerase subunit H (RpoH/RPB5)